MNLTFFLLIFSMMINGKTSDSKAEKVDLLFKQYNRTDTPGASVLIVENGRIIYKKSFGLADLENQTMNTPSTNYRLASVTKQFTAMAILKLIEQKKLSLETKLNDIFPDFPSYGRKITIKHLLTHTSGLEDYEDLIADSVSVPLRDKQVLELLKQQDSAIFIPGSKFRYSNSGYALLALAVERTSGQSFAEFLRENIFRPLKMDNTLAYEQGISVVNNRAYGYAEERQGEGYKRKDQSLTSSVLGDGGIYSSVEDLYKWDQSLYTNEIVSFETISEAFKPAVETEQENIFYGYGWFVETYRGLKTVWHYGSTVGFGTAIERFPEKNFTIIVLINRDNADAHKTAREIADIYL